MDWLALALGYAAGAASAWALLRARAAGHAPGATSPPLVAGPPPSALAPGPAPPGTPPAPAPAPPPLPPAPAPAPEPAQPTPAAAPEPAAPATPPAPAVQLVALKCPQCGAGLDLTHAHDLLRCAYCDVAIHVAGRAPGAARPAREPPSPSPGRRDRPPPFEPPGEPTWTTARLGRFEVAVLRRAVLEDPREVLRWVPLDDARGAVVLLRLLEGERDPGPSDDRATLEAAAAAAVEHVRARKDPGLAAKAALRAVADRRGPDAPVRLEAFVAVLDAARSAVTALSAGCPGALVHASTEEGRTIDPGGDHGALRPLDLRGDGRNFATRDARALAADDVVVLTSAAVAGEGRGWSHGQGTTHEALRRGWIGRPALEVARAVEANVWARRAAAWHAHEPPVGDLLVVAARVLGADRAALPEVDLPVEAFEVDGYEVAFAPGPGAQVWRGPVGPRRTAFVWLDGLPTVAGPTGASPAGEAPARAAALLEAFVAGAREVFEGPAGSADNPRAAGRAGLARAGLAGPEGARPDGGGAGVRALVLWLGAEHGKLAFFARGWRPPLDLLPRGERGGSGQQFDEGGEHWPRAGGRLVFPGALPWGDRCQRVDDLAARWPGGKASALWAVLRDHEDEPGPAELLRAVARAARADDPAAPLDGLCVVARAPGA